MIDIFMGMNGAFKVLQCNCGKHLNGFPCWKVPKQLSFAFIFSSILLVDVFPSHHLFFQVSLVQWTESVGLTLVGRDQSSMQLRTPSGQILNFTILQIFPFTYESKRMGIIVRVRPGVTRGCIYYFIILSLLTNSVSMVVYSLINMN